jgi:hypothetical protein
MFHKPLLLLAWWLLSEFAIAQNFGDSDYKNSLTFAYGWHHQVSQDLLFSPRTYRGSALPNLQLQFQRDNENSRHRLQIGFNSFTTRSQEAFEYLDWRTLEKKKVLPSNFLTIDLNYSYLKKIKDGDKLRLFAGAGIENQIMANFYEFGYSSIFGYTALLGFNPMLQADYQLDSRQNLRLELATTLGGWLARSPYALNDDEYIENQQSHRTLKTLINFIGDGNFQTVNRVQKVRFALSYFREISPRFTLQGTYRWDLFKVTRPRPLTLLQYFVDLGISYRF